MMETDPEYQKSGYPQRGARRPHAYTDPNADWWSHERKPEWYNPLTWPWAALADADTWSHMTGLEYPAPGDYPEAPWKETSPFHLQRAQPHHVQPRPQPTGWPAGTVVNSPDPREEAKRANDPVHGARHRAIIQKAAEEEQEQKIKDTKKSGRIQIDCDSDEDCDRKIRALGKDPKLVISAEPDVPVLDPKFRPEEKEPELDAEGDLLKMQRDAIRAARPSISETAVPKKGNTPMQITKSQLAQIIREEYAGLMEASPSMLRKLFNPAEQEAYYRFKAERDAGVEPGGAVFADPSGIFDPNEPLVTDPDLYKRSKLRRQRDSHEPRGPGLGQHAVETDPSGVFAPDAPLYKRDMYEGRMQLTKSQLAQIIREEYEGLINEMEIPPPRGYGKTGHEKRSPHEMWHGTPASDNWSWTDPRSPLEGSIYDRQHNWFPHPEDAEKKAFEKAQAMATRKHYAKKNAAERQRVWKVRDEGPYAAATDPSGVFAPQAPLGGVYDEEQQMSYPVREGRMQLTKSQLAQIIQEEYATLMQEQDKKKKKKKGGISKETAEAFLRAAGHKVDSKKADTLAYLRKRAGREDIHLSADDARAAAEKKSDK